jgi:hypothetical protein
MARILRHIWYTYNVMHIHKYIKTWTISICLASIWHVTYMHFVVCVPLFVIWWWYLLQAIQIHLQRDLGIWHIDTWMCAQMCLHGAHANYNLIPCKTLSHMQLHTLHTQHTPLRIMNLCASYLCCSDRMHASSRGGAVMPNTRMGVCVCMIYVVLYNDYWVHIPDLKGLQYTSRDLENNWDMLKLRWNIGSHVTT